MDGGRFLCDLISPQQLSQTRPQAQLRGRQIAQHPLRLVETQSGLGQPSAHVAKEGAQRGCLAIGVQSVFWT